MENFFLLDKCKTAFKFHAKEKMGVVFQDGEKNQQMNPGAGWALAFVMIILR